MMNTDHRIASAELATVEVHGIIRASFMMRAVLNKGAAFGAGRLITS